MRVLVLNDFLADWTGSEIVALEIAEHFKATTSSFWVADPVRRVLSDWRPLETIDLRDFDLVWAQQHAIIPLLDRLNDGDRKPHIIWASLSPYDTMDKVPASISAAYFDRTVGNSDETVESNRLMSSFQNAAPRKFHGTRDVRSINNILFVSNNKPDELLEAADILSGRGRHVRFLGRGRDIKRLEPDDIDWADCVVSIGKTVRYALASQTPVFIYDRFGGDGYLNAGNYALNEKHNFSGRPGNRVLTGVALADEIENFVPGWLPPEQPQLESYLDALAAEAKHSSFQRHPDLQGAAAMSLALGSWLAQRYAWKGTAEWNLEFVNGNAGSWEWLADCFKKKLGRSVRTRARRVRAMGSLLSRTPQQ